ncbi:MAG TPA: nitroreductase/quinone reductase family protein [Thermomicrobiales bacterium]|jgi:deazaflavin-dependent oxidoreductase (nitroreductase family)
MAETTPQPRRRPPDIAYKIINPILGFLLRSPLHGPIGKRLLLLEFTGRKSGKAYRLPVAYVADGENLLLSTQSRWKTNLRGGAPVAVWLGGKRRTASAELIEDAVGLADTLGRMVRAEPNFGQITGVGVGPDGQIPRTDLDRVRSEGFVGIRITLD